MNDVLTLFNCLVTAESQRLGVHDRHNLQLIGRGIVTDFFPTKEQAAVLASVYMPLSVITLFTREERETASIEALLTKQFLHYIEVYGLDAPGLFDLEVLTGTIVSLNFVHGITVNELGQKIRDILYANAPVKDAALVKRIVEKYGVSFDLSRVVNNELRVALWREGINVFSNGDDAVRFLCYEATGDALLIKSKEVIAAVANVPWLPFFFEVHAIQLAQVFNRHKRLILAAKNKNTAATINNISRLSKTKHVPIREHVSKTFIHKALTDPMLDAQAVLSVCNLRDKFKYLNLLAQKRVQSKTASFKIRNGKVHTSTDRRVYSLDDIALVEESVLNSLKTDLGYLEGQTILFDKNVDYGLPVSRKQSVGNLPFGTKVTSDGNEITSGMYWENAWGARDLDLSTIDAEGNRVGWGSYSGYTDSHIVYSGDLTDASNGAMEFMTSQNQDYGLFVNIYAGENGSEMELVVGSNKTKKQWIDRPIIRERVALNSKNTIIGFVKGKTFIVYAGRLNDSKVSGDNPVTNEMKTNLWTIKKLLYALGINYDVDRDEEIEYNHDLTYEGFSFDKLEEVFKDA